MAGAERIGGEWLRQLRLAMAEAVEADAAAAERRIGEILAEVLPLIGIEREMVAVAVTALATDRDAALALAKLAEAWWQLGQAVGRYRRNAAELGDHALAPQRAVLTRQLRQARRDHAAFAYALCLVTAQLAGSEDPAAPALWFARWREYERKREGDEPV